MILHLLHFDLKLVVRKQSFPLVVHFGVECGQSTIAEQTDSIVVSLIGCAKIHNINPEEYLSSIFELAADTTGWTDSNWSELLPWNIKLIKRSDISAVLIA
ncbi:MAG: transposase domain-containing protein [Treponema sp.]|nr:transposase domain-containing protein [Treponema sp.]